jgi:hypothetical protein
MAVRELLPASWAVAGAWSWGMPWLLLLVGCPSKGTSSARPSMTRTSSLQANARELVCAASTLAEVPGTVTALFAAPDGVYGVTAQDTVFRVASSGDGGPAIASTVASGERQPYPVVVRGGKPVWLSFSGLFGSEEDGGRQALAQGVTSVAVGARAVYFSGEAGLSAMDWPTSTSARLIAPVGNDAHGLVVAEPWVVGWSNAGGWAYNLDTEVLRDVTTCPDDLCRGAPRDWSLSADRKAVTWHEEPADLLPGPNPRAYRLTLGSWKVTVLSGNEGGSWPDFVVDTRCMFSDGMVRGLSQAQWSAVRPGDSGGLGPVANNGTDWFWVYPMGGGREQILSAPMAPCCDQTLQADLQ